MQAPPTRAERIPAQTRIWPNSAQNRAVPEGAASKRAENRERVVRSFEYSHYPRKARQQERRVGLTRDESTSGLCAIVHQPEPTGALLQIGLQTLDGEPSMRALALVVWCRARGDGRYALGLSLIERTCRRRGAAVPVRRASSVKSERLSA
jgi:hypothetical protein